MKCKFIENSNMYTKIFMLKALRLNAFKVNILFKKYHREGYQKSVIFNFPLCLNDYHTKMQETKKATIKCLLRKPVCCFLVRFS